MRTDVTIVGGGVVGCSLALRLAQSGVRVKILERGKIGCEASRAAAGMLSPQADAIAPGPFFDLCLRSRQMYRDFALQLEELSGLSVQYRDEGTLRIISDREDEHSVQTWALWQKEAGLPVESISPERLSELEPLVAASALGAVYVPEDHQVDNRKLMDALAAALGAVGVEVVEGCEVVEVVKEGNKATGVRTRDGKFSADFVIIAAGCWSQALLEPLGLRVESSPARGQMIALRSEANQINRVLHTERCYIVPRQDGRVLVGSTIEYVGFEKAVTASGINRLLQAAIEEVPAFRDFELVEVWAGLRPDTADHLPVLGPTPVDNLMLATGHFRNGILLAPVTAEIMTDCILTGAFPKELEPFVIQRFGNDTEAAREPALARG